MIKMIKCQCDGYMGNKNGAAYQNRMYGEGMRACQETATDKKFRCSVCGKEHNHGEDKK